MASAFHIDLSRTMSRFKEKWKAQNGKVYNRTSTLLQKKVILSLLVYFYLQLYVIETIPIPNKHDIKHIRILAESFQ